MALITPFTDSGDVDYAGLKTLLQYHLDAGTNNLCILGTTGEASALTMAERAQVLTLAVEQVKGQMSILVGTGAINPTTVREYTLQAKDIGCDASLLVTPYYVKPPQRALITHMTTMADLGLPVIMYNVPSRTGVNFLDASMAIAAQHESVIGVKDATGDLSRVTALRSLVQDPNFLLYSGDDATSVDFVQQGGDGCISVTANVAAPAMVNTMAAALAGQMEDANALNDKLMGLHNNLFLESNPMPVKWAAKRIGLVESAFCRPPLDVFDSAKFGEQLDEALKQAGLL